MVFTHIPASVCLIAAAFIADSHTALALLIVRSLLSQMDVPARSGFVMSVVTPGERAAAASFTLVPKSLASAAAPSLSGALFAAGMLAHLGRLRRSHDCLGLGDIAGFSEGVGVA